MTYGLGALPSPDDPRDHILTPSMIQAASAGLVIPDDYAVPGMPPHLYQNGYPTCTTHAGNQMKRKQEKLDGHGVRTYDQPRMYLWQKEIDGIAGEGSTCKAWCEVARKKGIPLKGTNKGVDKIAGYWRVDIGGDWDALKAAILVYGPVMWGGEFFHSWFYPTSGIVPKPSGKLEGGHATLWVGWRKNLLPVKLPALLDWGSWGRYKGSTGGGNVWVPLDYLSADGRSGTAAVWEMWKTVDLKGD